MKMCMQILRAEDSFRQVVPQQQQPGERQTVKPDSQPLKNAKQVSHFNTYARVGESGDVGEHLCYGIVILINRATCESLHITSMLSCNHPWWQEQCQQKLAWSRRNPLVAVKTGKTPACATESACLWELKVPLDSSFLHFISPSAAAAPSPPSK